MTTREALSRRSAFQHIFRPRRPHALVELQGSWPDYKFEEAGEYASFSQVLDALVITLTIGSRCR